jgi:hypothetical protein
MSLMKTQVTVTSFVALLFLMAFTPGKPLVAVPLFVNSPEKIIASKQTRSMAIVFTNDSGKLTAGDNNFCVLFQSLETATSADVHNVSVDFRLLVGRIQEIPITAQLTQDGIGRYCGRVNLGRQYYTPSSYYAYVHYADATGKKKTAQLHLTAR